MTIDVGGPRTVKDLLAEWLVRADSYREMGIEPAARAVEACASDLRAMHFVLREEEIPLDQAAEETGYSADHLRRLARDGQLHHTKEAGRYYVARQDLPRKARAPHAFTEEEVFDEPL